MPRSDVRILAMAAVRACLLLFLALGLTVGARDGFAGDEPSSQTTDWGDASGGLAIRVVAPKRVERGEVLAARIEWRVAPAGLAPGVRSLNGFLASAFVRLVLTPAGGGGAVRVSPYDPTQGMPVEDDRSAVAPLVDAPLPPWQGGFPLARAWDPLVAGTYSGVVEVDVPEAGPSWWPLGQAKGSEPRPTWRESGQWSGTLRSRAFPLEVTRERDRTEAWRLPKRLALAKGGAVGCGASDLEDVTIAHRTGFFVGVKWFDGGAEISVSCCGPPDFEKNSVDTLSRSHERGPFVKTYRIEVFEVAMAPHHLWMPGPGADGYRALWTRTYDLSYTEKQVTELR